MTGSRAGPPSSKRNKIAVFTAITGRHDTLRPPRIKPHDCDFIAFCDEPADIDGWQVRPASYCHTDPARAARFIKLHPHVHFEDYDASIWVDANIAIRGDMRELIQKLGDGVIGSFTHPHRDCVYDEAIACVKQRKDSAAVIEAQIRRYRDDGIPGHIGLWETGVLVRRHNDPACIGLMRDWWTEIETGSRRDQISFPVVLHRHAMAAVALATAGISVREHSLFGYERHRRARFPARTKPQAPPAPAQRKQWLRFGTIKRLESDLWGGYAADAATDLDAIAHGGGDGERMAASWALAQWAAAQGDFKQALAHASAAQRLLQRSWRPARTALRQHIDMLHIECLIRLGQTGDAATAIDALPGQSNDLSLMRSDLLHARHQQGELSADASSHQRLACINAILNEAGVAPITLIDPARPFSLDNIAGVAAPASEAAPDGRVSVLMPAYNASRTIAFAARSILTQTIADLELIIVDDGSTDNTWEMIEDIAGRDPRVIPIRMSNNRGTYAARNAALKRATGSLVTVNDADDWSHPQRLAMQMRAMTSRNLRFCLTDGVRVGDSLETTLAPDGCKLVLNASSAMVRRDEFAAAGGWDEVRFAADTELLERLSGSPRLDRYRVAQGVPLTFMLANDDSLTQHRATGRASIRYGARKEYIEAFRYWHNVRRRKRAAEESRPGKRPFPVPDILLPDRDAPAHYHVLYVADGSARGLAIEPLVRMMEAGRKRGLRQVFFNWPRPGRAGAPIGRRLRACLHAQAAAVTVHGDTLQCDLLVVLDPATQALIDHRPVVSARAAIIMAGANALDIEKSVRNVRAAFEVDADIVSGFDSLRWPALLRRFRRQSIDRQFGELLQRYVRMQQTAPPFSQSGRRSPAWFDDVPPGLRLSLAGEMKAAMDATSAARHGSGPPAWNADYRRLDRLRHIFFTSLASRFATILSRAAKSLPPAPAAAIMHVVRGIDVLSRARTNPGLIEDAVAQFGSGGLPAAWSHIFAAAPDARTHGYALEQLARALEAIDRNAALKSYWMAYGAQPTPMRAYNLSQSMFKAGNISSAAKMLEAAAPGGLTNFVGEMMLTARLFNNAPEIVPARPASASRHALRPAAADGHVAYIAASALPYIHAGYTVRTHRLLSALRTSGIDVRCLVRPGYPWDRRDAVSPDGMMPAKRSVDNVEYVYSPIKGHSFRDKDLIAQMSEALETHFIADRPAIVHAASNHRNALPALIAARRANLPFIYEMRGLWELTAASKFNGWEQTERFSFERGMEIRIASEADRVLTITQALADEIADAGVDRGKISILPNAVDPLLFKPLQKDARLYSEMNLASYDITLVYTGTLSVYEGLDDLIQAVAILRTRDIGAKLIIVGEGESRASLQRTAADLDLKADVSFVGRVPPDDVPRYASLSDIVALPRKPFPVCNIVSPIKPYEAMAMGKPVILSDLLVSREIVEHDVTGLLSRPADPVALADALERLARDPALRTSLGEAAATWVRGNRTWTANAARLREVYSEFMPG